jgi:hypothetical protein
MVEQNKSKNPNKTKQLSDNTLQKRLPVPPGSKKKTKQLSDGVKTMLEDFVRHPIHFLIKWCMLRRQNICHDQRYSRGSLVPAGAPQPTC